MCDRWPLLSSLFCEYHIVPWSSGVLSRCPRLCSSLTSDAHGTVAEHMPRSVTAETHTHGLTSNLPRTHPAAFPNGGAVHPDLSLACTSTQVGITRPLSWSGRQAGVAP